MTYKVAILDDEELIREGITMKYPFEENGFEIIFSDEDGTVLLDKLKNKLIEPDIIFVDILMPKLNGIEFIRKLREFSPKKIEVVIISGHDEFEYAQKAISLNVKEYLLKPLNPLELESVMEKVIATFVQKNIKKYEILQDEIANWLYFGPTKFSLCQEANQVVENMIRTHKHMYIVLFGNLQSISHAHHAVREFFTEDYDFEISTSSEQNLFIHFDIDEDYINRIYSQFEFKTITIAHFKLFKEKEDLPHCVFNGVRMIQHHLILGQCIHKTIKYSKDIEEHVIKMEESNFIAFQQFEYKKKQKKNEVEELRRFIEQPIPQYLKDNAIQQFARESLQYEVSIDWLRQFDSTVEFVDECMYLIQRSSDSMRPTKGKDILKSVLKDIETEYFMNLTIKDYAERYYIHPNHLVRLFKQEIESTFYQALMKIRMQKARQALTDTDKKIGDIAADVGYEDSRYFASVFRKFNRKTPNEYRNSFRNG